jgi:hypothetical protein
VSHGSEPCLLDEVSSDAATWPTTLGELCTTGIKKDLVALGTQLGSRVFKAHSCVTEAPADVHVATVRLYSAALAQLTTPGHSYRGDMTRQDGTMVRVMFSAVEDIICYS